MINKNRIKQSIISVLALLAIGAGVYAQEPPLLPPPPGGPMMGMFISHLEEGSSGKIVKGAPYSAQAVTETNQTLGDGNQIHRTATANLYRDSEGRTRREETMGAMGPWSVGQSNSKQIVLINDPVAGIHYMLDPVTHIAHKMPNFQATLGYQKLGTAPGTPPPGGGLMGFERKLAAGDGTVQTDSLPTQVVAGVQADGTHSTVTIAAGSIGNTLPIVIVTERWYSSQLQVVVMSTRTDPRLGTTTYRLTNINQTEPASALFQVPADYTVQEGPLRRPFNGPKGAVNP